VILRTDTVTVSPLNLVIIPVTITLGFKTDFEISKSRESSDSTYTLG
jgi:hypothetical protein